MWDKLHEYLDNPELEPEWDEIRFQSEEDYFADSFAQASPIWLMAINQLDSSKKKAEAYERIFHGVDLFETNDDIPISRPVEGPNYALATKPIRHKHNQKLLKKLGNLKYHRLCGKIIYPKARVPVLVFKDKKTNSVKTTRADFKNGENVTEHGDFLVEQISEWCKSGAVSLIGPINSEADKKFTRNGNFFNASIFVVENSLGKKRPIWNGHPLKLIERFKKPVVLDDIPTVMKVLNKGDILNKFDDKSGFHQLRLNDFSKPMTCFRLGGFRFHFNVAPFGIPMIPHHFQYTNMVAINYLRKRGLKVYLYLDDRLAISIPPSFGKAPRTAWLIVALQVALAGFISRKKSTFDPSTKLEFLGIEIDTIKQTLKIPDLKWKMFTNFGKKILSLNEIHPRLIESFRGKCCSFMIVAPMMRLFIRNMNEFIRQANMGIGLLPDSDVPLKVISAEIREEIITWLDRKLITTTRSWFELDYTLVKLIAKGEHGTGDRWIATDASGFGAGIVVDGLEKPFSFFWKGEEAKCPIHVKEAIAIREALRQMGHSLFGKSILLECDNHAVCQTMKFGAKDPVLTKVIKEIHIDAVTFGCQLVVEWVPSEAQKADEPSRELTIRENEIAWPAFKQIQTELNWIFTLDALATRWNKKAKNFIAWEFDYDAYGRNLLTIKEFGNHTIWAYPPDTILTEVAKHLVSLATKLFSFNKIS